MKKTSAGLLVYKHDGGQIKVLIAHMGGPWHAKKDDGSWTIPKGEYQKGEEPLEVAKREFTEELSKPAPQGDYRELGTIEQKNNKTVVAWTVEGDVDVTETKSNTFTIEWPPRSGKKQEFPEIDRAEWFTLEEAAKKLNPDQVPLLERLAKMLNASFTPAEKSTQGSLF